MTNDDSESIREAVFAKHIPPLRKMFFHTGVIVLAALVVGLVAFQFATVPPAVSETDASMLRRGWGLMAGLTLAAVGALGYGAWIVVLGLRARRETLDLITKAAIERLERKR